MKQKPYVCEVCGGPIEQPRGKFAMLVCPTCFGKQSQNAAAKEQGLPMPHQNDKTTAVTIRKHVRPRFWVCYGDNIGWTGPAFRTKKAAREWALKIGYQVRL